MENRRTRATILLAANGFVLYWLFQISAGMRTLKPDERIIFVALALLPLIGAAQAYWMLCLKPEAKRWSAFAEIYSIAVFLGAVGVWIAWRIDVFK